MEQFTLFDSKIIQPKQIALPNIRVKKSLVRERTAPDRQYKIICPAYGYRLEKTYSFSIALGIYNRSHGLDFRLTCGQRPACWRKLKEIIATLTNEEYQGEIVKC